MNHGWARLLAQQTSINVHCLPTKENERPFSLQQLKGCLPFHFPFAENNWKLLLSVSFVLRIPETWRQGHGVMWMET
jgi:hypothetical protein